VDADDAVRKGLLAAARHNGMIAATEISA
jgi:hypothetical protein